MSRLLYGLIASVPFAISAIAPVGASADEGDSCQSNGDCDTDAGEHCIKNVCTVPKKNKHAGSGSESGASQTSPGLQPGYT
jgi:hypothetical protein